MPRADRQLREYRRKRDFTRTAEPSGKATRSRKGEGLRFVVQKHAATRLHYDFRLELDGVLKSWAVTKGPSANPADKRLAVRVEDHPLDYGDFEGTIPKGEYGGGTVMLWDEGTWEPLGDPHEGLEAGDLKFRLDGKRMKGEWVLVHMKGRDSGNRENWLLIKHRDRFARETDGLTDEFTTSVETGRDLEGIAKGNKPRRKATARKSATRVWSGGKAQALPEFRPPQLATLVDEIPDGNDWVFETKYDGYRALAAIAGDQVRIYTRKGNDWTDKFGDLVAPLSKLTKGSAQIDGEITAIKDGRSDFSTLKNALSSGASLTYFLFDLLEQDGESLERLPLLERKERLRKLIGRTGKNSAVLYSEHIEGHGEEVFNAVCEGGLEGVIAKKSDAPYRHERTKTWLKIKCILRQEFVIGGWRPSDKKKGFASLLLGTWEDGKLTYRGRVGTGFNARNVGELQALLDRLARKTSPFENAPRDVSRRARWVTPDLVAEIAFTEFTPDGHLRHPSFIGLREDKSARDVHVERPAAPAAKPPRPKSARRKSKKSPPAELTDEAGVAAAERVGVRLTSPDRVVYPEQGVSKARLAAYYEAVAERMLPFIADRPLSLVRCPQGRARHCFYQKHDSGGFPDAMKRVPIEESGGETKDYFFIDSLGGLIAGVQMNVLEWHLWGSKWKQLEKPERIIFDIDPDAGLDFKHVRAAALDIRDALAAWGLETFPMVTGGKGIHVIAPIVPKAEWPLVKSFCRAFAIALERAQPERFTANMSKAKRKGRLFVDYLRNERGATAIAPWSTRSRHNAPVAVPLAWDEVETLEAANTFSLDAAAVRAQEPDPWPDYFKLTQSITDGMVSAVAGPVKRR